MYSIGKDSKHVNALYERIEGDSELLKLKERLELVSDSYFDFVWGTLLMCKEDKVYMNRVIDYLDANPEADTSDIIENTED